MTIGVVIGNDHGPPRPRALPLHRFKQVFFGHQAGQSRPGFCAEATRGPYDDSFEYAVPGTPTVDEEEAFR